MIVLDANVVSELMKAEPAYRVRDWLAVTDDTTITTAITVMEIEYGIGRLPGGKRKLDLAQRFASGL
jgi:toxin FitB